MNFIFGWFVPGSVYLVRRQYGRFAIAFLLVLSAFGAGIAADGMSQPAQSGGLALIGTAAKLMAGFPYLIARLFTHPQLSVNAPVHEYGATLLVAAGLINLLFVAEGH